MADTITAIRSATSDPLAIFTDFDGTLVGIAPRPDAIIVPDDLPSRLSDLYCALDGALAIVSGRSIADIDRYVPRQRLSVTGSHGAELRHGGMLQAIGSSVSENARTILSAVQDSLGDREGLLIEPKPTGVAVHFRAAPEMADHVRQVVGKAVANAQGFEALDGKMVVEARPKGADKGAAIRNLMRMEPFIGRVPVFLGDDVTDEDGFSAVQDLGGFGIKIGDGQTHARFRLPDIDSVYAYFDAVIAARQDSPQQESISR